MEEFLKQQLLKGQLAVLLIKSDHPLFNMLTFWVCITLTCELGVIVQVFRLLFSLLAKPNPKEFMIHSCSDDGYRIYLPPAKLIDEACPLGICPFRHEPKQGALLICKKILDFP